MDKLRHKRCVISLLIKHCLAQIEISAEHERIQTLHMRVSHSHKLINIEKKMRKER